MSTKPGVIARQTTKEIDAPDTLVGQVLSGRYRLDELMNTGGMGVIFRATQLSLHRTVAVKLLRTELNQEKELAIRFRHEVEIASRLCHPNLIMLLDSGQDRKGGHYLVMEFAEGETFRESLKFCKLTLVEIVEVFVQICDALTETHAKNVIHRDLKFDNVMVRRFEDGRIGVKLLDFGVAKLLTKNEHLTRLGEVPGTPGIIAPELVDGISPSPQSDLYSVGVLLYTSMTGQPPFKAENDLELMRLHRMEPVPNMREIVDERIPESIIDLIGELLEKEPKKRPATASEVRKRLANIARHLHQEDVGSRYIPPKREYVQPISPPKASDLSREFIEALEEAEQEPRKDPIFHPATIVAVLIAVLTIVVLILVYILYRQMIGEPI